MAWDTGEKRAFEHLGVLAADVCRVAEGLAVAKAPADPQQAAARAGRLEGLAQNPARLAAAMTFIARRAANGPEH